MKFSSGKSCSTFKTKIYCRPLKYLTNFEWLLEQVELEADSALLTPKSSWILYSFLGLLATY